MAERNAELLAQQPMRRRGVRTPEIIFATTSTTRASSRHPTPCVSRDAPFSAAITVLFSLIMFYGLQHFYAIENCYRVESEKQAREQLREQNRQLRLAEAQLSQPGRIDNMARQLGLSRARTRTGRFHAANATSRHRAPVLAQVNSQPSCRPLDVSPVGAARMLTAMLRSPTEPVHSISQVLKPI